MLDAIKKVQDLAKKVSHDDFIKIAKVVHVLKKYW